MKRAVLILVSFVAGAGLWSCGGSASSVGRGVLSGTVDYRIFAGPSGEPHSVTHVSGATLAVQTVDCAGADGPCHSIDYTTVHSAADGTFRLAVPAGMYDIAPKPLPAPRDLAQGGLATGLTVQPGETTFAAIHYDLVLP